MRQTILQLHDKSFNVALLRVYGYSITYALKPCFFLFFYDGINPIYSHTVHRDCISQEAKLCWKCRADPVFYSSIWTFYKIAHHVHLNMLNWFYQPSSCPSIEVNSILCFFYFCFLLPPTAHNIRHYDKSLVEQLRAKKCIYRSYVAGLQCLPDECSFYSYNQKMAADWLSQDTWLDCKWDAFTVLCAQTLYINWKCTRLAALQNNSCCLCLCAAYEYLVNGLSFWTVPRLGARLVWAVTIPALRRSTELLNVFLYNWSKWVLSKKMTIKVQICCSLFTYAVTYVSVFYT